MKHAGPGTLADLEPLLQELRQLPDLVERQPGVFYRRSRAFLHFHEDAAGVFADAKLGGNAFERYCVSSLEERRQFAIAVRKALQI